MSILIDFSLAFILRITKNLHVITSRMRGHLPIVGNTNLDVYLGRRNVKRETTFNYRFKLGPHSGVHASGALLADFEIFGHFF